MRNNNILMKKIFFVLQLILSATVAGACDICGCGAGNGYIGIMPEFYKHIFGVRYRYNSLYSHMGVNGATTYLTTHEKYNIAELWGGWTFHNKWRILVSLPYGINEKINQGTTAKKGGISDITISGYYQLMNQKTTVKDKLLVQSLWIGCGVKIATGQYNPVDKSGINQNANLFQLGTGSNDFIIAGMYDARLMDAGINFSGQYKINSSNAYHYIYGNKLNLSTQLYYKLRAGNWSLAPNAGLQYEQSAKDIDNKLTVDLTGGRLLLGGAGLEINYKKIAIGGSWQTPLSQNLGDGFLKANNRLMLHVAVAF